MMIRDFFFLSLSFCRTMAHVVRNYHQRRMVLDPNDPTAGQTGTQQQENALHSLVFHAIAGDVTNSIHSNGVGVMSQISHLQFGIMDANTVRSLCTVHVTSATTNGAVGSLTDTRMGALQHQKCLTCKNNYHNCPGGSHLSLQRETHGNLWSFRAHRIASCRLQPHVHQPAGERVTMHVHVMQTTEDLPLVCAGGDTTGPVFHLETPKGYLGHVSTIRGVRFLSSRLSPVQTTRSLHHRSPEKPTTVDVCATFCGLQCPDADARL